MKNLKTSLLFLLGTTSALETKTMSNALIDSYLNTESYLLDKGETLKKSPLALVQPKLDLS